MSDRYIKYLEKRIEPIIDGQILGLGHNNSEDDDFFFCIRVKCRDGKIRLVWILRDEEGNGSGAISIEEPELNQN
jgi:hypothetical protein